MSSRCKLGEVFSKGVCMFVMAFQVFSRHPLSLVNIADGYCGWFPIMFKGVDLGRSDTLRLRP